MTGDASPIGDVLPGVMANIRRRMETSEEKSDRDNDSGNRETWLECWVIELTGLSGTR